MITMPQSRVMQPIISTLSNRFGVGLAYGQMAASAPSSQSHASQVAYYMPMQFDIYVPVDKLFWVNVGTSTNNVDVGIYDLSWSKMVSSGAQTQAGSAGIQTHDVTDFVLSPGRYYFAISCSATTNLLASSSGLARTTFVGLLEQSSAHPLPSTATPTQTSRTIIPVMGIVPVLT